VVTPKACLHYSMRFPPSVSSPIVTSVGVLEAGASRGVYWKQAFAGGEKALLDSPPRPWLHGKYEVLHDADKSRHGPRIPSGSNRQTYSEVASRPRQPAGHAMMLALSSQIEVAATVGTTSIAVRWCAFAGRFVLERARRRSFGFSDAFFVRR